jgi:hypothetical protein
MPSCGKERQRLFAAQASQDQDVNARKPSLCWGAEEFRGMARVAAAKARVVRMLAKCMLGEGGWCMGVGGYACVVFGD